MHRGDKVEAILAAADEHDVTVFVGLGAYMWFTFSDEALCWSKRVAEEVWRTYGHHPSLGGWYIAGECGGCHDGRPIVLFVLGLRAHKHDIGRVCGHGPLLL